MNYFGKNFGTPNIGFNIPVTAPIPPKYVKNYVSKDDSSNVADPTYTDENSAYTQATFLDYLNNSFSGNLDYERTLELLRKEQEFSALEAQKSREFSERLSDTAYQRAVADLRKAGYNPALVLGSGGASTPSSALAQSTSKAVVPSGTNMTQFLTTLLTSATKIIDRVLDKNLLSALDKIKIENNKKSNSVGFGFN